VADVVVLTRASGSVHIGVDSEASSARVSIRCQGLNLPETLRKALAVGPEWPALSGPSGQIALNFAIACRLVALHGGEIRGGASSAGTTHIEVHLPLARGHGTAPP
jgi:nitrogen-specific signal transduction histidine kinase